MKDTDDTFSSFGAMQEGAHDAVDVDLDSCESVAQAYDEHSGYGTRLYHVSGDEYALSRYTRSVGQEWTEEVLRSGRLVVDPVALEPDSIQETIRDDGGDSLTDEQFDLVQSAYNEACVDAVWSRIEAEGTNTGLIVRGPVACVEAHSWRDDIRDALDSDLDEAQLAGVLASLRDALPPIDDWPWYQLYATYVSRLSFRDDRE